MRKKILAAALMLVCLAGCGSNKKNVDVHELASEIKNEIPFREELAEMNEQTVKKRYGLESALISDFAAYKATSAVADEIAVIKTPDTNAVSEKLSEYRKKQIASYESYAPAEVPKLNDGVIYSYNDTVIYVISEDADEAHKLVVDYTTN